MNDKPIMQSLVWTFEISAYEIMLQLYFSSCDRRFNICSCLCTCGMDWRRRSRQEADLAQTRPLTVIQEKPLRPWRWSYSRLSRGSSLAIVYHQELNSKAHWLKPVTKRSSTNSLSSKPIRQPALSSSTTPTDHCHLGLHHSLLRRVCRLGPPAADVIKSGCHFLAISTAMATTRTPPTSLILTELALVIAVNWSRKHSWHNCQSPSQCRHFNRWQACAISNW